MHTRLPQAAVRVAVQPQQQQQARQMRGAPDAVVRQRVELQVEQADADHQWREQQQADRCGATDQQQAADQQADRGDQRVTEPVADTAAEKALAAADASAAGPTVGAPRNVSTNHIVPVRP